MALPLAPGGSAMVIGKGGYQPASPLSAAYIWAAEDHAINADGFAAYDLGAARTPLMAAILGHTNFDVADEVYFEMGPVPLDYGVRFVAASNHFATAADSPSLNVGTGDFTLGFFGVREAAGDELVAAKMDGWFAQGYALEVTASAINFGLHDGTGTNFQLAYDSSGLVDKLTHYAVTADRDGNATFYVNGSSVGTADITSRQGDLDAIVVLSMQRLGTSASYRSGTPADFRLYKRLLSPAEVADWAAGRDVSTASLSAHWKFAEGTGTSVADASGNANTLTLGPGEGPPAWTTALYPSLSEAVTISATGSTFHEVVAPSAHRYARIRKVSPAGTETMVNFLLAGRSIIAPWQTRLAAVYAA